jgi:hypothetical protein
MKKIYLLMFLFISIYCFCDETGFIDDLYNKKIVTFSDGVSLFCYLNKIEVKNDFQSNVSALQPYIRIFPKKYSAEKAFTIGDFSLLAIQYLKIKSGIFYLSTHSGRYAARELMIRDIIPYNTSELEAISGEEIIRYMQKVLEYEENYR